MRYLFPGIMIVAVIALLAVLSLHPPGSINPGGETPVAVRSSAPGPAAPEPAPPAHTAANPPTSAPAPAPSATPAEPAPAAPTPAAPMQHGDMAMPHGGMAMHSAAAPGPDQPAAGTSMPAPATPPQPTGLAQQAAARAPDGEHGDAAAGRQVFRKCQACHSLENGKNLVGPSLAGIIGKKSGGDANFNYSPAIKQAGITWTPQALGQYLADPQKTVPGNRMPFPGLKSENDREDVIAFLATASAAPSAPAAAKSAPAATPAAGQAVAPQGVPPISPMSDVRYTLRSGIAEGRMIYLGVGGAIDGKVNPVLSAAEGQIVQVTIINGEGAEHDIAFPDQNARSPRVTGKGASTTIAFRAEKSGDSSISAPFPAIGSPAWKGNSW
jgi:nitrite reductase (NO-forming)